MYHSLWVYWPCAPQGVTALFNSMIASHAQFGYLTSAHCLPVEFGLPRTNAKWAEIRRGEYYNYSLQSTLYADKTPTSVPAAGGHAGTGPRKFPFWAWESSVQMSKLKPNSWKGYIDQYNHCHWRYYITTRSLKIVHLKLSLWCEFGKGGQIRIRKKRISVVGSAFHYKIGLNS